MTVSDLEEVFIRCPYCGETIQIVLDISSGSQEYYQDCSVCCVPIFFEITLSAKGYLNIVAKREDD
jgi:hypothetical protein